MSVRENMLKFLKRKGPYNTFTTRQAQNMFNVNNVSARISELRQEGYNIVTKKKELDDGRVITFYKLARRNNVHA